MKKNLFITVALLVVLVLGELLIWNKIVIPNEVVDYDLKKAKELVDKFYTDNYIVSSNIFKDGMTERYKISMAFNEIKDKLKEMECTELYKDGKKDDEGIVVGDGTYCDGKANTVLYADLERAYKSLFGNDAKLAKRTVGIFDYIKDENIFVYLSCRCGGVDQAKHVYDVKDATKRGKNLTINVYYYELEDEENELDIKKIIKEKEDKISVYQMDLVKEGKAFKLLEVKKVS